MQPHPRVAQYTADLETFEKSYTNVLDAINDGYLAHLKVVEAQKVTFQQHSNHAHDRIDFLASHYDRIYTDQTEFDKIPDQLWQLDQRLKEIEEAEREKSPDDPTPSLNPERDFCLLQKKKLLMEFERLEAVLPILKAETAGLLDKCDLNEAMMNVDLEQLQRLAIFPMKALRNHQSGDLDGQTVGGNGDNCQHSPFPGSDLATASNTQPKRGGMREFLANLVSKYGNQGLTTQKREDELGLALHSLNASLHADPSFTDSPRSSTMSSHTNHAMLHDPNIEALQRRQLALSGWADHIWGPNSKLASLDSKWASSKVLMLAMLDHPAIVSVLMNGRVSFIDPTDDAHKPNMFHNSMVSLPSAFVALLLQLFGFTPPSTRIPSTPSSSHSTSPTSVLTIDTNSKSDLLHTWSAAMTPKIASEMVAVLQRMLETGVGLGNWELLYYNTLNHPVFQLTETQTARTEANLSLLQACHAAYNATTQSRCANWSKSSSIDQRLALYTCKVTVEGLNQALEGQSIRNELTSSSPSSPQAHQRIDHSAFCSQLDTMTSSLWKQSDGKTSEVQWYMARNALVQLFTSPSSSPLLASLNSSTSSTTTYPPSHFANPFSQAQYFTIERQLAKLLRLDYLFQTPIPGSFSASVRAGGYTFEPSSSQGTGIIDGCKGAGPLLGTIKLLVACNLVGPFGPALMAMYQALTSQVVAIQTPQ
jgi:hypothetical protein